MHFDNSKYEFVNLEGFKNLQGLEWNTSQANQTGNIAMLWTNAKGEETSLEDGTLLFDLVLTPKKFTTTNDIANDVKLTLTNDITSIEAWQGNATTRKAITLTTQQSKEQETPNTKQWLSIYPNPAKEMVTIDCKDAKQITITDVMGRVVKVFNTVKGRQTFNTNQLPKGTYFVKATTHNGSIKNERLVLE